jgi:hypothetical protein
MATDSSRQRLLSDLLGQDPATAEQGERTDETTLDVDAEAFGIDPGCLNHKQETYQTPKRFSSG